nr:hypothetical protein PJ912_19975 [Pectobacterium colocasium]
MMTTDKKSKFSTIGMVLGALALLIAVSYFWAGAINARSHH